MKETLNLQNRYSILTNDSDHDDNVVNAETNNQIGSRKTRQRFNTKRHMLRQPATCLKLFSTNGAGVVGGKVKSLQAAVQQTNANLVTLQETHSKRKGRIQIEGHIVFEAIRKAKGGGTLISGHKDLNPKLIEQYEDEFELLVVEIELKQKKVRVISGYGPQENWTEEKRMPYFIALETEIEKATLAGRAVIVEMDANAKLGRKYIRRDPHEISPNGVILANIVERQSLVVGNGTDMCTGTITRKRVTKNRVEQSAIDIVLFSSDMLDSLVSVNIDEKRKYVLTKVIRNKKGLKKQESDHNPIITEFKLHFKKAEEDEKLELYNLKNKEGQEKFKEYTNKTKMLSTVFDGNDDINVLTERFMKKLDGCIALNFKKIRISKKKKDKGIELYSRLQDLNDKDDKLSKEKQAKVLSDIETEANANFKKLREELDKFKTNKGGLNEKQIWKLKKKLCPRSTDPPTAMLDKEGNLLTGNKAIERRAVEVYRQRLAGNQMAENLAELEKDSNKLCRNRLKICKERKSNPWDISDLQEVLKKLGRDKSRDGSGYANELFMISIAGDDLQLAVLKLLNMIKDKQQFPKALTKCNITSLHKKKAKNDFENYRGIFRITVLRSILDRLMYNESYDIIDGSLTDANVGARKERSCRDNLFVIGAVSNSVINGESRPIQVQSVDIKKF